MSRTPETCLLACGILRREMDELARQGRLPGRPVYLSSRLHNDYGMLKRALEGAIPKQKERFAGRVVVVYGDVCLGFQNEMPELVAAHGVVKVKALNCLDCQLGGGGRLLDLDPTHKILFLNQSFIDFFQRIELKYPAEEIQPMFSVLEGIILLDPLGDLDDFDEEIARISRLTGLPIRERLDLGLDGLEKVLREAVARVGAPHNPTP
ncbi:MAG: DUF1638 domain-containing protein [Deltaproteobacteria bacterium]|nr:DUF1638 domain-containing protein [Deltaproteobacteria bacterium]